MLRHGVISTGGPTAGFLGSTLRRLRHLQFSFSTSRRARPDPKTDSTSGIKVPLARRYQGKPQGDKANERERTVSVLSQIEASIPALRRYARVLLRHRSDADDLVQDCLLRALDHLDPTMGEDSVRPWLFTIARNLFASRLRKARVRSISVPLDSINEPLLSSGAGQEWSLSVRDILRGFDRLPDDQRQVLLLAMVMLLPSSGFLSAQ
jgi:RNA polymerase sigma-70 factor (ECF subfamily)